MEREICGAEDDVTNNQMELLAAIHALEALKVPCRVDLYTDSMYLRNAFVKKWVEKWLRNGWKSYSGGGVLNCGLWKRLIELVGIHEVEWHWVKGHAGDEMNRRCDLLARSVRGEFHDK